MAAAKSEQNKVKRFTVSLDTGAVILAFALALAVRLGLFSKVPW